jgi:hypothetical protein
VKVSAKVVHKAVGIVLKHEHLPTMRLAHAMTLKTVFIATCFLAHLAIPSQFCQPFGFDAVSDGLWGKESATLFCFSHEMVRIDYCCCATLFGAAVARKEQQEAELPIEMFDFTAAEPLPSGSATSCVHHGCALWTAHLIRDSTHHVSFYA